MKTLDLALCLFVMCPEFKYTGSLTDNTEESYNSIISSEPTPPIEELRNFWENNQELFLEYYKEVGE